jgi:hypothetical protein
VDVFNLRQEPLLDYCGCSKEPLDYLEGMKYVETASDHQLLKLSFVILR